MPDQNAEEEKVPLVAYSDFYDEWHRFPPEIQEELAAFLERLTSNPYDPALQAKCEVDSGERFSYRLPGGCVVYWTVNTELVDITGSSLKGMTVSLLRIQPPR